MPTAMRECSVFMGESAEGGGSDMKWEDFFKIFETFIDNYQVCICA